MKKLLFLTVLFMLFAVNAAAEIKSGTCGANITWEYNEENLTLTLTGSGAMTNFTPKKKAPWRTILAKYGSKDFPISTLVENLQIKGKITNIGDYAFYECTSLKKLEVQYPDLISSIGTHAFYNCSSLNIEQPFPNATIGDYAFSGCTALQDEYGVIYLGKYLVEAVVDCKKNVVIKGGTTAILSGAFIGTDVETIEFQDETLTSIGDDAFSGCTNLRSIEIPHTVTSWGTNIFEGCNSLPVVGDYIMPCKHVIVGVKNTGKSEYTIGEDVTYIAENAFNNCDNMQKIYCYAEKAPTSATAELGNSNSYILYVNDGCENDFYKEWKVALDRINTTEVAIGSSGYTTLTLFHSAKVPTGTKAYTATINNGSIELTQVSNLAKGVGYIIWSTNGTSGTYNFNAAGKAVGEPSENMMKGVLENTTLVGDGSIYLLSLYKGVVGFRCLGDNTYNLPAGKAYLQSDDSSGSVERDFLNFGGDETDIEDTKEDEIINSRNNTTYNLAGQKLNAPQKGLNIVDGKLVLL